MKICFLSIDVESASARSERASADKKGKDFEGVEKLDGILNIFKKHKVNATLFVTGEVLEKYPDLANKWGIDFEIGCHNYYHSTLNMLNLEAREQQIGNFYQLYQNVFKTRPRGFRAPRNIIDNEQFPILGKNGFLYDASVFPRYPWRVKMYEGYKGKAPSEPYWPDERDYRKKGGLKTLEIPEAGLSFGIPLIGTWIRKLGVSFYKNLLRIRKPEFISFSMHSWDGVEFEGGKNSGKKYLNQLDRMLGHLKKIGYIFKTGEEIYNDTE